MFRDSRGFRGRERREGANAAVLASLLSLMSLLSISSFAFNSEDWLGKRELFAREAERLRAAYSNCVAHLETPADDIALPVETFADGSVKTKVEAKRAQYFLDKGLVWAEGVKVRRFRADGTQEACIEATSCVVDRESRSGWAEGPASATHEKTTFRGDGIYFSMPDSYVKVLAASDVESVDLKFDDRRLGATNGVKSARITSRKSDFDREANVVMFEGDVVARYSSDYTMCADRLYMFLSGTNELSRVVALGNVSITNATRSGDCAMATYRRKKGEVEMFGSGTNVLARLSESGGNAARLEGTRIRFWLDTEQVEVDNPRISAESKGGMKFL